jgi:hypothetical protein
MYFVIKQKSANNRTTIFNILFYMHTFEQGALLIYRIFTLWMQLCLRKVDKENQKKIVHTFIKGAFINC